MQAAYYEAPIVDFLAADEQAILGALAEHHAFALEQLQRDAWIARSGCSKRLSRGWRVAISYLSS